MSEPPTDRPASADPADLRETMAHGEVPGPARCVELARGAAARGALPEAYRWLAAVADHDGPYLPWAAAATQLAKLVPREPPDARRSLRIALAGTYTTSQLGALLRVAALRRGLHVVLYETAFNTHAQEILDPTSGLYAFDPDYVIIAPHAGAVDFPSLTDDPERLLDEEIARWRGLWEAVRANSRARVIQHTPAVPVDSAWGHLAARTPGSRDEMLRTLNARLARNAGDVMTVDCDRIAATFGKARWFDDRYWHLSGQAVALDALPTLARHTAAVLAAAEGLGSRCLVVDLDDTLWGGVVAEDGIDGIVLGGSPRGEAHLALQNYLRALRARGILLAVVSKNDDAIAREPFERHPDMRLSISDFAVFLANWRDKAANLRRVAAELGLGVDALAFADDNPAERELVRHLVPGVEVVALGADPAGYVRAIADTLLFESVGITDDDLRRSEHYRARALTGELRVRSGSLAGFYRELGMRALTSPFAEADLPRILQLLAKTNQFNLSGRRHGPADVRAFMADADVVTLSLRLRDRFGDHGLVALLIGRQDGRRLDIDTWLMSCRVIARTVENEMLARLAEIAADRGCDVIGATFVPTARNRLVCGALGALGFRVEGEHSDGRVTWRYDLGEKGAPASDFISGVSEDAVLAA